jgi:DNA-binding PadR family transcriptional regulator
MEYKQSTAIYSDLEQTAIMASHNTLTFALLGLLAERPSSAYELATQVQTSIIRGVWPSAASHTYAQVKQLVRLGYATVERTKSGKRVRSVYAVTAAGRDALRAWLSEPESKGFALEYERLLKFMFCEVVAVNDARILAGIERETHSAYAAMLDIIDHYLDSSTPIESAARKGAVLNLLIDLRETCLAWSRQQADRDSSATGDGMSEYHRARDRLRALLGKG